MGAGTTSVLVAVDVSGVSEADGVGVLVGVDVAEGVEVAEALGLAEAVPFSSSCLFFTVPPETPKSTVEEFMVSLMITTA